MVTMSWDRRCLRASQSTLAFGPTISERDTCHRWRLSARRACDLMARFLEDIMIKAEGVGFCQGRKLSAASGLTRDEYSGITFPGM
jgi:hypothetical protein